MTDTKWSSPTGYSVANRETDKLPPKTSDFLTRGQDDVQDALDDLKTLAREMSVTRHVKFSDCLLHILDDLKRALAQQQPVNDVLLWALKDVVYLWENRKIQGFNVDCWEAIISSYERLPTSTLLEDNYALQTQNAEVLSLLKEFVDAIDCGEQAFIDHTGRLYKESIEAIARAQSNIDTATGNE